MLIAVTADVQLPNGARSYTGTVMTTKILLFQSFFVHEFQYGLTSFYRSDVIQNGEQDFMTPYFACWVKLHQVFYP